MGAPVTGMIILGIVQTWLALMTISPTLSEQFSALVNLAVVTNVLPYIIAAVGADRDDEGGPCASGESTRLNATIALIGMAYSVFAIYASGNGRGAGRHDRHRHWFHHLRPDRPAFRQWRERGADRVTEEGPTSQEE